MHKVTGDDNDGDSQTQHCSTKGGYTLRVVRDVRWVLVGV